MDGNEAHNLFGDLWLDDPEKHLTPQQISEYRSYREHLDRLQTRLNDGGTNAFHHEAHFESFREKEVALWAGYGVARPAEEILRVSGCFQRPKWIHYLHNSSFSTLTPHNGETADYYNPCIATVMASGCDDETVIIDHTLRRDEEGPILDYPSDILHCHEDVVYRTMQNCPAAAVEIVYGKPVRHRICATRILTELKLWGSHDGLSIFLDWSCSPAGELEAIRRILVLVAHPQRFFRVVPSQEKIFQERVLTLAAKMAKVPNHQTFYQMGHWKTRINLIPFSWYEINEPYKQEAIKAVQQAKIGLNSRKNPSLILEAIRDCVDPTKPDSSKEFERQSDYLRSRENRPVTTRSKPLMVVRSTQVETTKQLDLLRFHFAKWARVAFPNASFKSMVEVAQPSALDQLGPHRISFETINTNGKPFYGHLKSKKVFH